MPLMKLVTYIKSLPLTLHFITIHGQEHVETLSVELGTEVLYSTVPRVQYGRSKVQSDVRFSVHIIYIYSKLYKVGHTFFRITKMDA